MRDLLINLAAGILLLVIASIYAQRKEIRGYLATQREGWIRKLSVKAFVGAARGEVVASDAAIRAFLILAIPIVLISYFLSLDRVLQGKLDLIEQGNRPIERSAEPPPTRESLDAEARQLTEDQNFVVTRLLVVIRLLIILCSTALLYLGVVWFPYTLKCRQFAYELERFTLRIQGLASKSELAEFALAESRVKDEDTLRSLIEVARAIAARHQVPELVSRFDLWQTSPADTRNATIQAI